MADINRLYIKIFKPKLLEFGITVDRAVVSRLVLEPGLNVSTHPDKLLLSTRDLNLIHQQEKWQLKQEEVRLKNERSHLEKERTEFLESSQRERLDLEKMKVTTTSSIVNT